MLASQSGRTTWLPLHRCPKAARPSIMRKMPARALVTHGMLQEGSLASSRSVPACPDALVLCRGPRALQLPLPITSDPPHTRKRLKRLLELAEAQRQHYVEGSLERPIFGAVELTKAFRLAGDLGVREFCPRIWSALAVEAFRLARASQLDSVGLYVTAISLTKLRAAALGPGGHRVSLPVLRVVADSILTARRTAPLRHLAGIAGALARLAAETSADTAFHESVVAVAVAAAEALPERMASTESVGGREVGFICDATRLLGLRNDGFLEFISQLLRCDWDMIWTPLALTSVARCLSHFGHRDRQAWRALAHRIVTELPTLQLGNLSEVVAAFAGARIRSDRLNGALARAFVCGTSNLSAGDIARICHTCVMHGSWFSIDHEAALATSIAQSLPRRALDFSAPELRVVLEALMKWAAAPFWLDSTLLKPACQGLYAGLTRRAGSISPSGLDEILGVLQRLPLPEVTSGVLCRALATGCQERFGSAAASPEDAAAITSVLHHLSIVGVPGAGFYRAGVIACIQGLAAPTAAAWLAVARLLGLCGRVGIDDEALLWHLVHLFSTARAVAFEDVGGRPGAVVPSLGLAMSGLAALRVRPPEPLLRQVWQYLAAAAPCTQAAQLTSPAVAAFPAVLGLLQLDALRSTADLAALSSWFEDPGALSRHALAELCLAAAPHVQRAAASRGCSVAEVLQQRGPLGLLRRWRSWMAMLAERLASPAPSARGSAALEPAAHAIGILGLTLFTDAGACASSLEAKTLARLSSWVAGAPPEMLQAADPEGGLGTLIAEVGVALRHILAQRGGVRIRRPAASIGAWSAASGALALVPRCSTGIFVADFVLLHPCHPPPPAASGTVTIFYPRPRRLQQRGPAAPRDTSRMDAGMPSTERHAASVSDREWYAQRLSASHSCNTAVASLLQ